MLVVGDLFEKREASIDRMQYKLPIGVDDLLSMAGYGAYLNEPFPGYQHGEGGAGY